MDSNDITYLSYQEGEAKSYFEALKEAFGGEITDGTYEVDRGPTKIRVTSYPILPEFELATTSAQHNKAVLIDRDSDDNPETIHVNVIKKGRMTRTYDSQEIYSEAGESKGVFIYNGLFPMNIEHQANSIFESVNYTFSKTALLRLLPEAIDIVESLFENEEPLAYHTNLPMALDVLVEDIFLYKKSEFGKKPLVVARGLELFTLLMKSVKKLVDQDELHGLHIDDYQRLLKIKERLLSSFDQKISIEKLAKDFGISVSKLKRDFKTLFDTSVYQFYTHAKMDEAYRRLQTGDYSVMEVGYDLGYTNLSKFSQMFKKVKGINPKEVRDL